MSEFEAAEVAELQSFLATLPSASSLRKKMQGLVTPHTPTLRVGILGSTNGTDMKYIIDAASAGHPSMAGIEIAIVVSNRSASGILAKARAAGIPAKFVGAKAFDAVSEDKERRREAYDKSVTDELRKARVDLVLLIGYMRILSASFCADWENRCLNVHPSLLPAFAGGMDSDVHGDVIASDCAETGCTIHFVTATVDGGPIVIQKRCPVVRKDPKDTPATLKAKVQVLEGEAFLEALSLFKAGAIGPRAIRAENASSSSSSSSSSSGAITYKDAGVDIDAGNRLVERIKPVCKSTLRPGCDADLGGFGGLFDLSAAGYGASPKPENSDDGDDVILVGATDGVGTKLKVAQIVNVHQTVGIDLVAMCVNDLLVQGAEPLFFLDYFATGKLSVNETAEIVEGIAEGCRLANCGLIGGETAEMPSMYGEGEYDLGGFSVGALRRRQLLPRTDDPTMSVAAGDIMLGLSSSGLHSNGFSLVRKLVERSGLSYGNAAPFDTSPSAQTLGDALLVPTKIYVRCLMPILRGHPTLIKAMAHITGGGLPENLPRVLPSNLTAVVDVSSMTPLPPVFKWLHKVSELPKYELMKTLNCGVGMVLICAASMKDRLMELLSAQGETPMLLGKIIESTAQDYPQVVLEGDLM